MPNKLNPLERILKRLVQVVLQHCLNPGTVLCLTVSSNSFPFNGSSSSIVPTNFRRECYYFKLSCMLLSSDCHEEKHIKYLCCALNVKETRNQARHLFNYRPHVVPFPVIK